MRSKITSTAGYLLLAIVVLSCYVVFLSQNNTDELRGSSGLSGTELLMQDAEAVISKLERELRELKSERAMCNCGALEKENIDLKNKYTVLSILDKEENMEKEVKGDEELSSKIAKLKEDNEKVRSSNDKIIQMEPVKVPYFCPPEVSNHNKWEKVERPNINYRFGGQAMFQDRYYASNKSHWFCDKLQNNLDPWVEPKLSPDDFVIGMYTGERIFYSRSSVVVDTWLHRFKHHYLYAALGEPSIPVQGLEKYNLKPEYRDSYVTAYVQIWGLKDLYYKNPNAKWYYIVGCDTFLNSDYMMRALESFDPSKDWWISSGVYPNTFQKNENLTGWDKWWGKGNKKFDWFTGAVGWFLSNSVMKAYAENIDKFMTDNNIRKICYCPDKITGMVLSLLGYHITKFPNEWVRGWNAMAVDGKSHNMYSGTKEYVQYHYVSPYKMAMAEHRVTHEKLDRIINAGDPNRVVSFFREFIDKHYSVLKRRMRQVKYLARIAKDKIPYRTWDIPCVDPAVCKEKPPRRRLEETDKRHLLWNSWGLEEEELLDDIPESKLTEFLRFKF